jgi:phage shock protein PspC (stress-responsive transcriptional regulator)
MNIEEARQKFGLGLRELEVISGVVAGYTIKEMGDYYQLEKFYVRCLVVGSCEKLGIACDKLNAPTKRELARFAVEHELPLVNVPAKKKPTPARPQT